MKRAVWMVTLVVCLGKMCFAMANNAQGVLLTDYINTFGLTGSMQGLPSAAAHVGNLLAMLLSVPLAARVGKLSLHAVGLAVMALMLALAGTASYTFWLVAAMLMMGFGFGSVDTTASAIVADLHTGKQGRFMLGVLHAAYGLGGILAPVLMTAALSAGTSWRYILWALAVVVGVVFLVAWVVFSRAQDQLATESAPPDKVTLADLKGFLLQPGNVVIISCAACYCAHQASIYLWVSRIIGTGFSDVALGAAALSLFWVGTVISRLVVPLTGITPVRYMRVGMLVTGAVQTVAFVAGSAALICVAAALSGFAGGASLPMLLAEIKERNASRSMLAITAVLLTTAVAAIVCAPLIGFVVGQTTLLAGVAVAAVFAFASGAAAFALRPTEGA